MNTWSIVFGETALWFLALFAAPMLIFLAWTSIIDIVALIKRIRRNRAEIKTIQNKNRRKTDFIQKYNKYRGEL